MLPAVIDVRSAEDTRDVVHRAVQALVEGRHRRCADGDRVRAGRQRDERGGGRTTARGQVSRRRQTAGIGHTQRRRSARLRSPDVRVGQAACAPLLAGADYHGSRRFASRQPLAPTSRIGSTGRGTVGDSRPAGAGHPLVLDIMRLVAGPMALTSANRGGDRDAVTAEEVVRSMEDDVQLVLDDGRSRYGQPSSVVRVKVDEFEVLAKAWSPNRLSSAFRASSFCSCVRETPAAARWPRRCFDD